MKDPSSAEAARQLLSERVAAAPDFVARVPSRFEALEAAPVSLPRSLVTTGIGTSEAHARHLAEVSSRFADQPARFMPTGALAGGVPAGAEQDWLVVFSQGLSANARFALRDLGCWGCVVLLCGLPRPDDPEFARVEAEKAEWLLAFRGAGGIQIDLGCGTEYGLLVRVIGARVGYAAGWSLLRSLARRALRDPERLRLEASRGADAQIRARARAAGIFRDAAEQGRFFAPDRALLIVGEAGEHLLFEHLALKLAEGMMRPAPRLLDVLEFTHGPLQSLADRPASILYLAPREDAALSGTAEPTWLGRLRTTLDPARHDLRVLRAELAAPFAVLEYEAIFDAFVLDGLEQTGLDLSDWPSRGREDALYRQGPSRAHLGAPRRVRPRRVLAEAVWPEIDAALGEGRKTAILGLGSVEQHGPHLPLGTDAWIADALAEELAARFDDAWALPALALGVASEHLGFPGTLHLEPQTLERVLVDLLRSLEHHGFERAFLFTAHGGNVDALDAMRDRLAAATSLDVVIETDLAAVGRMQAGRSEQAGLDGVAAGPHAGEFETSLIAALRPGSIRVSQLQAGELRSAAEAQRLFYPSLREHAALGVVGDPRRADADRGRGHLRAWVDLLEVSLRDALARQGLRAKNRQ